MIFIALGANLPSKFGSPVQTLLKAIDIIQQKRVDVLARSSVWLTAPVPVSDQPYYHNAVIAVESDLSPKGLLLLLHEIEEEMGRVRTVRNAPRVIDLDLIAYDDVVIAQEDIYIPHPRMHERGFVLKPFAEIVGAWTHPVLKRSLPDLLSDLPDGGEQRMDWLKKAV